jgi:hypothetical protein
MYLALEITWNTFMWSILPFLLIFMNLDDGVDDVVALPWAPSLIEGYFSFMMGYERMAHYPHWSAPPFGTYLEAYVSLLRSPPFSWGHWHLDWMLSLFEEGLTPHFLEVTIGMLWGVSCTLETSPLDHWSTLGGAAHLIGATPSTRVTLVVLHA